MPENQTPVEQTQDVQADQDIQTAIEEDAEYFEIEVDEDDILYYLVDEDDNEVGFAIMENGEEVEYFYADDGAEYEYVEDQSSENAPAPAPAAASPAQSTAQKMRSSADAATDKVITLLESDKLTDAATEFSSMYKQTADATKEIREAMKDVKDTIDMFNPRKLFR